MALIAPLQATREANEVVFTSAAETGDTFANASGRFAVLVNNGSASPVTVSFPITLLVDGEAVADKEVIVPAGEIHLLGTFPPGEYNDEDGEVTINYSDHTDVSVAVIRV